VNYAVLTYEVPRQTYLDDGRQELHLLLSLLIAFAYAIGLGLGLYRPRLTSFYLFE
jgi:hypothetical protein